MKDDSVPGIVLGGYHLFDLGNMSVDYAVYAANIAELEKVGCLQGQHCLLLVFHSVPFYLFLLHNRRELGFTMLDVELTSTISMFEGAQATISIPVLVSECN